MLLNPHVLAGE